VNMHRTGGTMKKEKPTKFITESDTQAIYENIIKDLSCSRCGNKTFQHSVFDTLYDEDKDDYCVLSFDIFCKGCGNFLGKYNNSNTNYWFK